MRFQWNRLGRTDNSEVLDQQRSGYIDKRHAGYICPCCGLELYSEWTFHLQGFGEPIDPDFDKMQDEAVVFAQLKECPCCGGTLIHDQEFFIQVESPAFCNVLFFKNCVCLYLDEMFVDEMYYLYPQRYFKPL